VVDFTNDGIRHEKRIFPGALECARAIIAHRNARKTSSAQVQIRCCGRMHGHIRVNGGANEAHIRAVFFKWRQAVAPVICFMNENAAQAILSPSPDVVHARLHDTQVGSLWLEGGDERLVERINLPCGVEERAAVQHTLRKADFIAGQPHKLVRQFVCILHSEALDQ
jgi:hypothetical protein